MGDHNPAPAGLEFSLEDFDNIQLVKCLFDPTMSAIFHILLAGFLDMDADLEDPCSISKIIQLN